MSKLTGNWSEVQIALKNLKNMRHDYHDIGREIGDEISSLIREYIENQELSFTPLADDYLRTKIRQGYDPRTLIRTGEYVESIEVTDVDVEGDDIHVFVSVEDKETETNISMKELAEFIEYGTEHQPARFPFRQSWERMRPIIKREIERRVKQEVEMAVNV